MRKVSVNYRRGDPLQEYSATVLAADIERAVEMTRSLFEDDRTLVIDGCEDLGEAAPGSLPTVVLYDLTVRHLR